MCQWFAPTKLVVTFETEGMGAFTQEDIDRYIIRDENGNPTALDLPTKFVFIANHQVLFDVLAELLLPQKNYPPDLRRLVVRMVFYLFYEPSWHTSLRVHYPEKESPLGTHSWLGRFLFLFLSQLNNIV